MDFGVVDLVQVLIFVWVEFDIVSEMTLVVAIDMSVEDVVVGSALSPLFDSRYPEFLSSTDELPLKNDLVLYIFVFLHFLLINYFLCLMVVF